MAITISNKLEKILKAGFLAAGLSFGVLALVGAEQNKNVLLYLGAPVSALSFFGRAALDDMEDFGKYLRRYSPNQNSHSNGYNKRERKY